MNPKLMIWGFAIVIASMSCKSEARNNSLNTVEQFEVFSPKKIDTVYYNYYVADIMARNNVEIRSRVKGYLEKIHIDEGEQVKKGQLLFSISSQEYQEELLKAEANYTTAVAEMRTRELELQNAEMLLEKEVISKTEVDMAKARLKAAQSQVAFAKSLTKSASLNLAYTHIRSPFSGYINRIQYKVGSLIDESTLMTTLSDVSEVFAYFNVSEKEYLDLVATNADEGDEVSLILANGEEHIVSGIIETIEGEFDQSTGSISYRARFDNPGNILRHGSSGKIKIAQHLHDVIVIPQKSTFEIQDKNFVYILNENNEVEMRLFEPELRLPQLYTVASGIDTTDKVVFEGVNLLRSGQEIEPVEFDIDQFLKNQMILQ